MLTLSSSVTKLHKVGIKNASFLKKLQITKIRDLLLHFPSYYNDFSKITKISEIKPDTIATLKGKIITISNKRSFKKRMYITEAILSDESGSIKVVWFNQPFLAKSIAKNSLMMLSGKVIFGQSGLVLQSPAYEYIKEEQVHTGRIVPVYPVTGRLTPKIIRYWMKLALPCLDKIKDYLPREIKQKENFLTLRDALKQIHFPDNAKMQEKAKRRLAFDEMFKIQLAVLSRKKEIQENKAPKIKFKKELAQSFVSKLPYKLTNAQRRSAWEIILDIEKNQPMNRLLEGDVGSGKTIVSAIAIAQTTASKFQAVFMAPTEVLAKQHFKTFLQLLKPFKTRIALLTSSQKLSNQDTAEEKITKKDAGKKDAILEETIKKDAANKNAPQKGATKIETTKKAVISQIKNGEINLIIGTHSLIQEKIAYKNIGLVIIDEQHRFGVEQRKALKDKTPKLIPHFLSMTATPIPRTLTLTLYGDLDISILDEMPKGRKKILTRLVPPDKRDASYEFIRTQIRNGRQAFVICPLIEESDKLGVKAAKNEYEKLQKQVFRDLRIGLLHGKMKSKLKNKVMEDFTARKIDMLVSTAVIEVGVDVPNATVMIIEGAHRFGLAQLHQFRGRVGRSTRQSYCFLFTDSYSRDVRERLFSMVKISDGFKLAEKDLIQRGPGEVYGKRQSGIPDLKMASLTDLNLIKKSHKYAAEILEKSIEDYPALAKKVRKFKKNMHWE